MLSFLNKKMFFSLIAVLLPVIIHFFIKAKVKKIEFPAIFFLKETIKKKNNQIRFSQFLLLFVRILIMLFLALSVMMPVLKNKNLTIKGSRANNYVLIIDTSLSLKIKNKKTRQDYFSKIKNNCFAFLDKLSSSDSVTIFTTDDGGKVIGEIFTNVSDSYINNLASEIKTSFYKGDILATYKRATALLGKLDNSYSSIIIFSDFQKTSSDDFFNYLKSHEQAYPLMLATSSRSQDYKQSNISIQNIDVPFLTYLQKSKVPVQVSLTSSIDKSTVLSVYKNDLLYEETEMKLFNDVITNKMTLIDRDRSKIAAIHANISGDQFIYDNDFYAVFEGPPIVRVLLLEKENDDGVNYSSYALNPFASDMSNDETIFDLTYSKTLDSFSDLSEFHCIIVSDLTCIDKMDISKIKKYLDNGGSMIISFNELASVELYNEMGISGGLNDEFLTPATLLSIKSFEREEGLRLTAEGEELFPIMTAGSLWKQVTLNKVIEVDKPALDKTLVLVETLGQDPVVLLKSIGNGQVCWLMTDLHSKSTSFVLSSLFLPFMHRTVDLLTKHNRIPFYYTVGDVIILNEHLRKQFIIKDSFNNTISPVIDSDSRFCFKPEKPGIYSIIKNNNLISQYGVNADKSESIFTYNNLSNLNGLIDQLYTSIDGSGTDEFIDLKGREIPLWKILSYSILIFMCVEILIISRIRS